MPLYADPLRDIGDQLGIRVITYVRDDVEAVAALLAEQLPVLDDRDFGELTASQGRFGYASRHLQVEIEGRVVQVQLRTVLQHAWAEFEHDIRYKGTVPAEHASEFDRRFTLAAGLLELADQEFSAIRDRLRGAGADRDRRRRPADRAARAGGVPRRAVRRRRLVAHRPLRLDLRAAARARRSPRWWSSPSCCAPPTRRRSGARMDYRYPPGAVRRLDDALLSAFGERYVAPARQRAPARAAAAPASSGFAARSPRRLDNLRDLSHHGDMSSVSVARPRLTRPAVAPRWASPWAMYAALRDHDPVHHVVPDGRPHEDYYVLTRHEDVLRAAVDTATFSSAQGLTVEYGELEKIGLADNPPMVMLDPPEHTAFRRLVSRGFTPRAVREVEPEVRAYVVERLERLRRRRRRRHRRGPVQAAAEHGRRPLPRRARRGPRPVRRLDRRHRRRQLGRARRPRPRSATTAMLGYFAELIERRRREPGRRHRLAPGRGRGRRRRRRAAQHPRLRLRDGDRRQRHHDRRARRRRPAARRAPRPARPAGRRPDAWSRTRSRSSSGSPRRCRGWPAPPPATSSCTASRSRPAARCCSATAPPTATRAGTAPTPTSSTYAARPTQILTFGQGSHHCIGNAAARMMARVALEELLARIPSFAVDLDGGHLGARPLRPPPAHRPLVA